MDSFNCKYLCRLVELTTLNQLICDTIISHKFSSSFCFFNPYVVRILFCIFDFNLLMTKVKYHLITTLLSE